MGLRKGVVGVSEGYGEWWVCERGDAGSGMCERGEEESGGRKKSDECERKGKEPGA